MSWVAEAVATSSAAPATTISGEIFGLHSARIRIAAISRNCDSISQPRRRPSRRDSTGTSSASTTGAQRNLMV